MLSLRILHCQPGIDEAESAAVIERALAATDPDFHFRITVATHPFRALEHFEEQRFDAAVVYRETPFLSAREVLDIVRRGNDRTPMFLLVEQEHVAGLSEEDRRGFVDVLPLPFSANHILRAMRPVMTHIRGGGSGPFVAPESTPGQTAIGDPTAVSLPISSSGQSTVDALSVVVESSEEVEYFDFDSISTSLDIQRPAGPPNLPEQDSSDGPVSESTLLRKRVYEG